MRIVNEVIISPDKLTHYLLVWRPKSDKSRYLSQAGFTLNNPAALDSALRTLVTENEAVPDREDEYGLFVQIEGYLIGPTGRLHVITVWILPANDSRFRFVTLKPAR